MLARLPYFAALFLAAAIASGNVLGQARSDAAREKRWADQFLASLVVGDAVRLKTGDGIEFLALYTQPERARVAVLLAHGPGLHPDHGVTGELRIRLADRGYATLSLQMPVLPAEIDSGEAYQALFPEATRRIAAGLGFLQGKNFTRIALVSHAMGSGMTYEYLKRNPDAPVAAWVALSFYGVFKEVARRPFPVFDLYGQDDYRGIRGPAAERKTVLDTIPGSKQFAAPGAGRFLAGGEKTILQEVPAFLDTVFR